MSDLNIKLLPAAPGSFMANRAKYGLPISEICIHHMAGVATPQQCRDGWASQGRQTSSNYGLKDVDVAMFVSEGDIAYCNGNWDSNRRAVSIEVSNSAGAPNWPVSDASLNTLIELVADIAKRNNLHPLVVGKSLTYHSMYAATACPGPYLKGKMQYICEKANEINNAGDSGAGTGQSEPAPSGGLYRVQVGAFTSVANAQAFALKVKKAGFDAIMKQKGKFHHVQVGAFSVKKNAEAYLAKVKKAGFEAVLVQE